MVQQIDRTSLGGEVGRNLSQGLGQGLAQGSQMGVQRGMLQNALQGLGNLPQNASAFDLAKSLISATAGIPGAERYVGQLFPLLLTSLQGDQIPGNSSTSMGGQPAINEMDAEKKHPASILGGEGGLLRPEMGTPEMLEYAKKQTRFGIPLDKGLEMAKTINESNKAAIQNFQNDLRRQGISDQEMPYATQMAQMSNAKDFSGLTKDVLSGIDEVRQLQNAAVPSFGTKLLQDIGSIGSGEPKPGEGSAMLESREKRLSRIHPIVERLKKKGYDPLIRNILSDLGFSRTEMNEALHPLQKPIIEKINKLPKEKVSKDMLSHFIRNNIEDQSLLALRDKLWREKDYDWRDISTAVQDAVDRGMTLTPDQEKELVELYTQPPRQSLQDMFLDWYRPAGILKGEK